MGELDSTLNKKDKIKIKMQSSYQWKQSYHQDVMKNIK